MYYTLHYISILWIYENNKQEKSLFWVENETLLITLKDKTGNVILKCSTQNEVMVSKAPAQPRSEIVCQQNKQRAGTIPASGTGVQLSVTPSFAVCIPEQAEFLRAVKSGTGSLQ